MIIDPYSGAQYMLYFRSSTSAEIEEGKRAAREERIRLRAIREKSKINFERESSPTKPVDNQEGKLVNIILKGNMEDTSPNTGKNFDDSA
jgi:hypothetical protein